MKIIKTIAALLIAAASISAYAHSGGKNGFGCHTDHSTGLWHCH